MGTVGFRATANRNTAFSTPTHWFHFSLLPSFIFLLFIVSYLFFFFNLLFLFSLFFHLFPLFVFFTKQRLSELYGTNPIRREEPHTNLTRRVSYSNHPPKAHYVKFTEVD